MTGYTIKPLTWTHFPKKVNRPEAWEAEHAFGVHFIEYHPEDNWPYHEVNINDGISLSEHQTLHDAMTAIWNSHCSDVASYIFENRGTA